MSVYRDVPLPSKGFERTDVIKVTVGHHNRGRTSAATETRACDGFDVGGRTWQTRINQHPVAIAGIWKPDKDHIDDDDLAIGHIDSDLARTVVASFVLRRIIRTHALGN